MSIEVKDLSYRYPLDDGSWAEALTGVSFCLPANSFTALIGHTGSGKSTLAQLLCGLLRPAAGSVELPGWRLSAEKKARVNPQAGLLFQYPEQQLFGETVAEDVAYGLKNAGLSGQKLAEAERQAFAAAGLDHAAFAGRDPMTLSGGEKRLAALAGVLALRPALLILDEPTAGLDGRARQRMMECIRSYHAERGATLLWITHNMEEITELADRLLVLDRGRLLADGSPAEVFARAETLLSLGLDLPETVRLQQDLKRRGWQLPPDALTEAALVRAILAEAKGGRC